MVKRKITLCSESLRFGRGSRNPYVKYSYDGEAIIELLKKHIETLKNEQVAIEAIGFGGKEQFMQKIPRFVKDELAEYRHRGGEIEVFIIVLRDSDTNDSRKISALRRKLTDGIKKFIGERKLQRVYVMFAVQAIEAWILADEQKLNEYLGVTNKAKHENAPEKIENPKQIVQNLFKQCGREYTPQELRDLLPQLQVSELSRCKHFQAFYDCVIKIAGGAK